MFLKSASRGLLTLGNSVRFQTLQKFVRVELQVQELKNIGIRKKFLGCLLVRYIKNTSHIQIIKFLLKE